MKSPNLSYICIPMKKYFRLFTFLLLILVVAKSFEDSLLQLTSEIILVQVSDLGGPEEHSENEMEEKEDEVKDIFRGFYCQQYELTTTFSSFTSKILSASHIFLNADILLESPPPKS